MGGGGGQLRKHERIINVTNRQTERSSYTHSLVRAHTQQLATNDGFRTNECNDEHSWNGVRSFTL